MTKLLSFIINEIALNGYQVRFDNDDIIHAFRITLLKKDKYVRQIICYEELLQLITPEDFLIDRIKYMIKSIEIML